MLKRILLKLFQGTLSVFILILAGFVIYLITLPQPVLKIPYNLSHAVVFTGGAGRINLALDILTKNPNTKIIISGIHRQTSLADITAGYDLTPQQLNQIALDYTAQTTRQNVTFIKQWSKQYGVKEIGIITSAYHVPRVKLLVRLLAPELTVTLLPVRLPTTSSFFLREYVKLLATPWLE
ncbi:MAG: YdcF family protein [Alphaproteobacteria bacterium]|nr:YdcF family protein [Alphaproteobacteria bacterium]